MAATPPHPLPAVNVYFTGEAVPRRISSHAPLTFIHFPAVTCNASSASLNLAKKYRLALFVHTPVASVGLGKQESRYSTFNDGSVLWEEPFGPSL